MTPRMICECFYERRFASTRWTIEANPQRIWNALIIIPVAVFQEEINVRVLSNTVSFHISHELSSQVSLESE